MTLQERRRALMAAGGGDPNLKYSLENKAVSAGDYFSSGFAAFAADVDCTILLDFTLTSRPASGNAANFKLIYGGTSFQWGTRNATTSTTDLYFYWQNTSSYIAANVSVTAGSRYRICVTHSANSNTVYVKQKKGTGDLKSKSDTRTFTARTTALSFGNPNATNGLPNGTINSAKVYDRVFTSDEISAFFA